MMMSRGELLVWALVLGFTATPVMAQTADTRIRGGLESRDSVSAPDSVSASAPDSARIILLEFMVRNSDDVRINTGSAGLIRRSVAILPGGLQLREPGRGIGSSAQPDRIVRWAEIESIEVREGAGSGPLVGGAIGLAIGLSIYMAQVPLGVLSLGQHQPSGVPILLGLAGGATLGWLVDRPGPWQTVFP